MYTYRLYKYCGAIDDEPIVFEHEDQDTVVTKALEVSVEDNWYSREYNAGIWTYRLERIKDGERNGGWRFFNHGRELTDRIRAAVSQINRS